MRRIWSWTKHFACSCLGWYNSIRFIFTSLRCFLRLSIWIFIIMTWTNCITSFSSVNFFGILFHYKITSNSFIIAENLLMWRDTRSRWKTQSIDSLSLILLLLGLRFFVWSILFDFIFSRSWSKFSFFVWLLKSNFFICKCSGRFDSIEFCCYIRVTQTLKIITTWPRLWFDSWDRLISFG